MNNTAKKDFTPDSYHPKSPRLIELVEDSQTSPSAPPPAQVKTKQGVTFIDGIPALKWGQWKDCTYAGCVTVLLQAMGYDISYEEVMGLSGAAFRLIMRDDWDPSSEMPQNGLSCEENASLALGIAVQSLPASPELNERAKQSICKGIPVLTVGQRGAPEWCLTCGYGQKDGADLFFGRTYFDCFQEAKKEEFYTENEYLYADNFPGWFPESLTRFYDTPCEPIAPLAALKVSLETCIKMFEQPPSTYHKYGYDAYDVLIAGMLLEDEEYQNICRNDQYHIGSLQDARRAASLFLQEKSALLEGENRAKLIQASEIYRQMLDNLLAVAPYEKRSEVFNGSASPAWTKQQRAQLAQSFIQNKELEKQVRVLISQVLENWPS